MHLYTRLRERIDRESLAFVTKINVLGFGLLVIWTVVNITLLPARVEEIVPGNWQGTALGLISFLGVGLAVFIQPLAGRLSDVWPGRDRRRPFILVGIVVVVPGLVLFGGATGVAVLLAGYLLMQLATNISQAAFQAFIPDLVEDEQRGIASGAQNLLRILGAALGLLGAQGLVALGAPDAWVVAYIGGAYIITGLLTLRWVPRIPPNDEGTWQKSLRFALDVRKIRSEITSILREHRTFRLGVLAQFLFILGTYPVQRFLVFFLRERYGGDAIMWAAIGGAAAIVLAAVAAVVAGAISDAVGRSRLLVGGVVIGSAGMVLIGFSTTLLIAAIAGGVIAVGYGAFLAVNWALLNDDLPEGRPAAALGIANIATAGAGAVAGLFGPLVDVMGAVFPQAVYEVLFGLGGLVAVLALLPIRRISRTSGHSSVQEVESST